MSNGHGGIGGIEIKQDEGTYDVRIGDAWSSAENWVRRGRCPH